MLVQSFLKVGGKNWRLTKIPAWFAKTENPDLMPSVAALVNGAWVPLETPELVDEHVPDWEALQKLESAAMDYNYGFLENWRPVKPPASMRSKFAVITCRYMDPIFSTLISANYATLHEMRTVYSLEDVFMMIEALTVSSINEHNAMEKP